jgi:uncharacterized membrane protein YfcA
MSLLGTLSFAELAAACGAVCLGAIVQGSVGFGIGLVAAPLLMLLDPMLVPGPILFCGLCLAGLMTIRDGKAMDLNGVKWGVAGRLVGTVVAGAVLSNVPKQELTVLLGSLVLLAVGLSISGLHLPATPWTLVGAGTLSGFMSTIASIGGPPMALLFQRRSGARIRSTMAGFFFVGTLVSLVTLVLVGEFWRDEMLVSLVLLPGMLMGFVVSRKVHRFLDRGYMRVGVLTVSAASGLAAILRQIA